MGHHDDTSGSEDRDDILESGGRSARPGVPHPDPTPLGEIYKDEEEDGGDEDAPRNSNNSEEEEEGDAMTPLKV